MGNGSGVSRGDRNRNARLARLRVLVPTTNAVVGIDLADSKQMVVVTDHDSKVLARKTFRCRAWDLGTALDWADRQASQQGFAGVTVACEPTGHRWRVLGQLAAERGMSFVCVQPMLMSWARRSEDLTFDKTDEKDAVIIARLAAQLRCYIPEPVDETWGRLRHLGARREQLLVESGSQVQQIRALLECVWPAALGTARQPFRSLTWTAVMSVVLGRDAGDLARTRRLGLARLETAVRREITRRGRQRPCLRIVRLVFAALSDPAGVTAHRPGALERVSLLLTDWLETHRRLGDTELRMTSILDQLRLTELVTSITGLSAIGAARSCVHESSRCRSAQLRQPPPPLGQVGGTASRVRIKHRRDVPSQGGWIRHASVPGCLLQNRSSVYTRRQVTPGETERGQRTKGIRVRRRCARQMRCGQDLGRGVLGCVQPGGVEAVVDQPQRADIDEHETAFAMDDAVAGLDIAMQAGVAGRTRV
jgi:transposase